MSDRRDEPITTAPLAGPTMTASAVRLPLPSGVMAFLVALILGAAVIASYGGGTQAPFIFDDEPCIVNNPSIMNLLPLWGDEPGTSPLRPPQDYTTAGRPLVNLSLALNIAYGALDPGGFHVFNMALHFLCATLLWGIVRRTLVLDYFNHEFDRNADLLALCAALVWAVHPLNTEAVEYISQRTELMMGLFYLLTLYASLRYWNAKSVAARAAWLLLAGVACFSGMASKEVMVSAPVVVLLFERTFVAGTFRRAARESWPLYITLGLTWGLLFALNSSGPRSASAGFHLDVPAHAWWFTQAKVLFMYLKLAVWPWPLVIHYDVPYLDTLAAAWRWLVPAAALGVATLVLLWRRSAVGFVFVWVLLILSPTLVVPIISEVAAERRMYLPLAALVTLVVVAGYKLLARLAKLVAGETQTGLAVGGPISAIVGATVVLAVGFATLSAARLGAYRDALTLWRDAVSNQPENYVAHTNYGVELLNRRHLPEAIEEFNQALRFATDDLAKIHLELGTALSLSKRFPEAIEHFEEALRVEPEYPDRAKVLHYLGMALLSDNQPEAAIQRLREALREGPDLAEVHMRLGLALVAAGQGQAGIDEFDEALRVGPDSAEVHNHMGLALYGMERRTEAMPHFMHALKLRPDSAQVHYNLGVALRGLDQPRKAVEQFQQSLRLQPDYPAASRDLGLTLVELGRTDEALAHLEKALDAGDKSAQLERNLGLALASAGRKREAVDHLERAKSLTPGDPAVHCDLGAALVSAGRAAEASDSFREALRLSPDSIEARAGLARAYAQLRRGKEALTAAEEALDLAKSRGQTEMAEKIELWLKEFRNRNQ
jgi:tetratricopeptide (TPR) repeat protein